jgi:hypothetical protein
MSLALRLEYLRQRGAAERLAIQIEQLALREQLGALRRGAGWVRTLLRVVLRGRATASALAGGGGRWLRLVAWVAPWLLVGLRARRARRGRSGASAVEGPERGGEAGWLGLATALLPWLLIGLRGLGGKGGGSDGAAADGSNRDGGASLLIALVRLARRLVQRRAGPGATARDPTAPGVPAP